MAFLLPMIGGAVINAVAFSGSNFLFHQLSSSDEERKRHDLALEKYTRDHTAWVERRQQKIDEELKRRQAASDAERDFKELDQSMIEYRLALDRKNPEPQFTQYYAPDENQINKDYIITCSIIVLVGGIAYYMID